MILYRVTWKTDVLKGTIIKFREFETLDETKHYWILEHKGVLKKSKKNAKYPFASQTKIQALESLIYKIQGFKFSGMPQHHPTNYWAQCLISAAKKELKTLKEIL